MLSDENNTDNELSDDERIVYENICDEELCKENRIKEIGSANLKIIQCNLKKSSKYTQQLINKLDIHKINIAAIQEPYTYLDKEDQHYKMACTGSKFNIIQANSTRPIKAAIAIRKNITTYLIDEECTNEDIVVVMFDKFVMVSMYFNLVNVDGQKRDIKQDLVALEHIVSKYKNMKLIILTDTNSRNIVWGDCRTNERGDVLNDFILYNELTCLNDGSQGPTFKSYMIKNDQFILKQSYIDLTLCNRNFMNYSVEWLNLDHFTNSDHNSILICFKYEKNDVINTRKTIDFKKSNWEQFIEFFNANRPTINDVDNNESLDFYIDKFNKTIELASKKFLKYRKQNIYSSYPWYNDRLVVIKNKITKDRRKLCRIKNIESREIVKSRLKELNKQFSKLARTEKYNYYKKLHEINSPDEFWKVWSKSRIYNAVQIPIFEENTDLNIDKNNEILGNHFVKEAKYKYERLNINTNDQMKLTDTDELNNIINNLNNNKAPGPDNVTNRLIKILYTNDREYFVRLFNLIIKKAKIPTSWRTGKLIFLNKKNRVKVPKDLRPITLISGWCKIVEVLFIKRIENRLNELNFFNDKQFGFVKNRSTVDALEFLINEIEDKSKKYKFNVLISIDISGAFDNVCWRIIMKNLEKANLENKYLKAAQNLLIDRTLDINNKIFKSSRGCPQGGCASPTLWRIAMNSLLNELNIIKNIVPVAFADDLIVLINANSLKVLDQLIKDTWSIINKWCDRAELKVNVDKTNFMLIKKRKLKKDIHIENKKIEFVKEFKYLGVVIDHNLNFNSHINHIKNKINLIISRINKMRFLKDDIEFRHRMKLYFNVFIPTITYGSRVWFKRINNKITYIEELRLMQRKFLKILHRLYRNTKNDVLISTMNVIDIIDELKLLDKSYVLDKKDRKSFKIKERENMLNDNLTIVSTETKNTVQNSKSRFTLFVITDTGPFKSTLYKMKIVKDEKCRYCDNDRENSNHLFYDCNKFKTSNTTDNQLTPESFEARCIKIVKQLHKDTIINE
jgi:hypothetical protein